MLSGPDSTGKSTLAGFISHKTGQRIYHFTPQEGYLDYLEPLSGMEYYNAILDRWFWDELPYCKSLGRPFRYTLKEWHNLWLLTLAHNPVIVLAYEKSREYRDTYLPEEKWETCLRGYEEMYREMGVQCHRYSIYHAKDPLLLIEEERKRRRASEWWTRMWMRGYGGVGGHSPDVILIAEVLSPLNTHLIPFEAGPSGHYLSEILDGMPLSRLWITNWVKEKSPEVDRKLLKEEIEHLKPRKAIILGRVARESLPLLKEMDIEYSCFMHPSAIVRFHRGKMDAYREQLRGTLLDFLREAKREGDEAQSILC